MIVTVNAGHSAKAPGASGNGIKEHEIARQWCGALITALKQRGFEVVNTTSDAAKSNDVLKEQVVKCNAVNSVLDLSIHFNAASATATGTEAFYYDGTSSKSWAIAGKISEALAAALGLKNRGAKPDTASAVKSLYFLRKTKAPAVLIEVAFVTNAGDMQACKNKFDKGIAAIADVVKNELNPGAKEPAKPAPTPSTPPKKSDVVIADEVIKGKWGNGDQRKQKLEAAGYNYSIIQGLVNQKLGNKTTAQAPKKTDLEVARECIDRKWGNGQERKDRLTAAGYDYNAVQSIINRLMK